MKLHKLPDIWLLLKDTFRMNRVNFGHRLVEPLTNGVKHTIHLDFNDRRDSMCLLSRFLDKTCINDEENGYYVSFDVIDSVTSTNTTVTSSKLIGAVHYGSKYDDNFEPIIFEYFQAVFGLNVPKQGHDYLVDESNNKYPKNENPNIGIYDYLVWDLNINIPMTVHSIEQKEVLTSGNLVLHIRRLQEVCEYDSEKNHLGETTHYEFVEASLQMVCSPNDFVGSEGDDIQNNFDTDETLDEVAKFCHQMGISEEQFYGKEQIKFDLDWSRRQYLPKGICLDVVGYINLKNLKELPPNTTLKTSKYLDLRLITTLPEFCDLSVGWSLNLDGMTEIPKHCTLDVKGQIYLKEE